MPKQKVDTKYFVRGIPKDVYLKAKSIAVLQGKTMGQYITQALIALNSKNG